jgi:acyl dehydratase
MPLAPDLLGSRSEPVEFAWTHDDAMLYALAVGAGQDDPLRELAFTTENTVDTVPAVLPTFANIVTRRARVPFGDIDPAMLVHAEQSCRLHAPLPLAGRAIVTATVTEVLDKGRGALVRTTAEAVDDAGVPLASTVQSVFIRGEGGFGGPRGEPTPSPVPDTAPDVEITFRTAPGQALVYRLTGDRNPLHTDPAFARRGGFDVPILHGMCTYGFTARALLQEVCGGDAARFAGMDARFTRPVLPGAVLTVAIWRDGGGAHFRTIDGDGDVVLDRGRLDVHA